MSEGQENLVQEEQTVASEDTNVDYKSLYLDEVQNDKKLRKRAQEAETTIQNNTKSQETLKVKQMKEQEKYKELYESVAPFKDKWESYETNRRESLLSKLPESDRESLSQKDLDTLEYIVRLKDDLKPSKNETGQHTAGTVRNVVTDEKLNNWSGMTEKDKKDNWSDIVGMYAKKQ